MKPNLFIAGAPKCGTTAWVSYLGSHPQIFFSDMKEPSYFARDLQRVRLVHSIKAYEKLFERGRACATVGEASALYLCSTEAAQAIAKYNPEAKILIFLRRQEDYLRSLHQQFIYRFAENIEDFETAWRLSSHRPPETIPPECPDAKLLNYDAMGDFHEQVERFFGAFPADQIRVFHYDDWASNPRAAYVEILGFLGLEDDGRTEFPRVNEAKAYRIKWLGKLIAHPPRWAELIVAALRKITGRSALGIGARASSMLADRGYKNEITPELRREIQHRYEAGNALLTDRLWKPRLPAEHS